MYTKILSKSFLIVTISYINFCVIPCNRSRDLATPKIMEKAKQQRHLWSDFHQKLIDTNIRQGAFKYKISWSSVHYFSRYTCHKIFVTHIQTHRQTDRHFPKMVKTCSGCLKTCKSIKNRKSKIFTKPILSSYLYRRK